MPTDITTRVDTIRSAQRFAARAPHSFPNMTEAAAFEILRRAQIEADFAEYGKTAMCTSARLCEQDAARAFERGDWAATASRALDSLTFSAGLATQRITEITIMSSHIPAGTPLLLTHWVLYVVERDPTKSYGSLHSLTCDHLITATPKAGDKIVARLEGQQWWVSAGHGQAVVEEATLGVDGVRIVRHGGRGALIGEDGHEDAFGGDAIPELGSELLGGSGWGYAPVELVREPEEGPSFVAIYHWRRTETGDYVHG